ncbi:hypothetical protein M427DRAFT_291625 [Gonapodya prolifera JEL478]|uniref:Uncharacterized protein n=1 Tax=Gonapodya prolifera (strain JEL478) TaxID=1344416 RepID=A0A139AIA4_GONPJ|nr:hypothetical protein M427DRAFT_291625 [Gonapodya prolifera JEL478]|eukprot:KXS16520.1 hypothetical protein M427DRAFT_291625 [Gonapodya prolifera JEL478]
MPSSSTVPSVSQAGVENTVTDSTSSVPPREASWTGGAPVGSIGNPPVDPIEREMWERKRAEVLRDIYDPFGSGVGNAAQLVTAPPPISSPASPFSRPTPSPGLGVSSSAAPLCSMGSFERLGRDRMHLLGLEDEEPIVSAGQDLAGGGVISPMLPTGANPIAWFPAMPLNEVWLTSQSSLPHPNLLSTSTLPLSASLNESCGHLGCRINH